MRNICLFTFLNHTPTSDQETEVSSGSSYANRATEGRYLHKFAIFIEQILIYAKLFCDFYNVIR